MEEKILVIEDNANHLDDVRKFFEERKKVGLKINVDYSDNYTDAESKLQSKKYDGVISDIFYPLSKENSNKATNPLGLKIGNLALELRMPIVFVSDINVHEECHDVLDVIRNKYHQEGYYTEFKDVSGKKLWKQAFVGLMFLIEGMRSGLINIDAKGIHSDLPLYSISQYCRSLPDIGGEVYFYEGSYLKIYKFKNGKEVRMGRSLSEMDFLNGPTTLEDILEKMFIDKWPLFSVVMDKYGKDLFAENQT